MDELLWKLPVDWIMTLDMGGEVSGGTPELSAGRVEYTSTFSKLRAHTAQLSDTLALLVHYIFLRGIV